MEILRWILVAGTGRQSGLPESVVLLAQALGRASAGLGQAEPNFGLVVGGWPGVDYLVAQSFDNVL